MLLYLRMKWIAVAHPDFTMFLCSTLLSCIVNPIPSGTAMVASLGIEPSEPLTLDLQSSPPP